MLGSGEKGGENKRKGKKDRFNFVLNVLVAEKLP